MKFRVLPYRQGSKGAKALATGLGGRVLKLQGSKWRGRPQDLIINWGNTDMSNPAFASPATMLNGMDLREATNKRNFFQKLASFDASDIAPPFWVDRNDIPDDAYPIVCRQTLAGHSGEGIVIANTPEELVPAPLYVQYIKKKDEYRVHVGRKFADNGYGDVSIISLQRKARRLEVENPNWQVRNHSNGCVYVRNQVNPPPQVLDVARQALAHSGLDFGAVDVIWNDQKGKAYVLEINTAPGLEGTTVSDYVKFFKGG